MAIFIPFVQGVDGSVSSQIYLYLYLLNLYDSRIVISIITPLLFETTLADGPAGSSLDISRSEDYIEH